MNDATFVQYNTAPDIKADLYDEDDPSSPLDLTGATVKFQMRRENDRRFTVDADASVVNAPLGQVSYSWQAHDLDIPGDDYQAQWEVTFLGGRKQTQAQPNTVTVRRA